jgi:hypothetical protein
MRQPGEHREERQENQDHRLEGGEPEDLLTHRCPRLNARFNGPGPCERNQERAKALEAKGIKWLGPLEHCRECKGKELEEIAPEGKDPQAGAPTPPEAYATMADGVFCARHPEERQIVIEKEGPRQGQVMGACRKCLQERKLGRRKEGTQVVKPGPPQNPCPNHPENERHRGSKGNLLPYCRECYQGHGKKHLVPGAGFRPGNIVLNFPDKHQELRQWLVDQAEEHERTPAQEIFYLLKIAKKEQTKL